LTTDIHSDWPNLAKYRKANEDLKDSSSGGDRIVLVGDSITEGWTEFNPGFFQENNMVNRGISGQTTPQMLIRLKQDAIHLDPKIIIINGGTNDIWGNTGPSTPDMIIDNLCSMAEITAKKNIQVVLSTILPVYQYPDRDDIIDPPKTISFINSVLQNYCKKNSLAFLDYFSPMADEKKGLRSDYGTDGVHPNKQGYSVMEQVVRETISGIV
tara:strand:+ start:115 stop:750 length:636 start_codon:yes stop_codon:yes gene_type:complete